MNFSKIKIIITSIAFLATMSSILTAQVKVGDNPDVIDSNSILELESDTKVLVITRLSETQMNALSPLHGALVYNIDAQCIFAFDGTAWKNLCDQPNINVSTTSPVNNKIGDFWFNSTNNIVSVWNGNQWLPINVNPRRGNGLPTASITNAIAGDIYVDQNTGAVFTYNGTIWIPVNKDSIANNGVSIVSNEIRLGGSLITPTIITTDALNTLAIQGLQETILNDLANNSIVVVNNTSGELKKVSIENLVTQQQVVVFANNGQSQFNTPLPIIDSSEIDVYRNGARIGFSIINDNTIEVETEAICYQGDEIRIVQLTIKTP